MGRDRMTDMITVFLDSVEEDKTHFRAQVFLTSASVSGLEALHVLPRKVGRWASRKWLNFSLSAEEHCGRLALSLRTHLDCTVSPTIGYLLHCQPHLPQSGTASVRLIALHSCEVFLYRIPAYPDDSDPNKSSCVIHFHHNDIPEVGDHS
jgi:hypothetical protein